MPFLGTILGWLGGGLFKVFGNDVLGPILKTVQNSQNADRDVAVQAIAAEMAANDARARLAPEFKLLIYLIALPFAAHSAMVMLDSCIPVGFPHMGIPAAPHPFVEWEGTILLSFFIYSPVSTLAKAGAARLMKA